MIGLASFQSYDLVAVALIITTGSRVPVALRIFLTAAAIVDDIGAKTVMAIFYSGALDLGYASGAAVTIAALALLNRPAPTASRPMCRWAPCCGPGRALGERISSLSLSLILDLPGAHRPRVPTAFAVSLARRGSWRHEAFLSPICRQDALRFAEDGLRRTLDRFRSSVDIIRGDTPDDLIATFDVHVETPEDSSAH
jgi:hypothetical protein